MIVCMSCYKELEFNSKEFNKIRRFLGIGKRKYYYNDFSCFDCDEDFVEIDDDIYKSIIELNKKGYKTNFCCSGHNKDKDSIGGYISFAINLDDYVESIPEGWEYEGRLVHNIFPLVRWNDMVKDKITPCIRYEYGDDIRIGKSELKEKRIKNMMNSLNIWVDGLIDLNVKDVKPRKYFLIDRNNDVGVIEFENK